MVGKCAQFAVRHRASLAVLLSTKQQFKLNPHSMKKVYIASCAAFAATIAFSLGTMGTAVAAGPRQVYSLDGPLSAKTQSEIAKAMELPAEYLAMAKAKPTMSPLSAQEGKFTVTVNSLNDLPTPVGGIIKLESKKTYMFSGLVNIGANAFNLNGAALRGHNAGNDGVFSTVNGAVVRSKDQDVFMQDMLIMLGSSETKAYDFQDVTGTKYYNLFSGSAVLDAPNVQSGGVGTINGMNTTCIDLNYWKAKDGIKITGQCQKFTMSTTYVTGISQGAAIEFLGNAVVADIIIQASYFVFAGQTGLKVNPGAIIDQARVSFCLFRGAAQILSGIDSFTPGWEMISNGTGLPDSKGNGFLYMADNTVPTGFKTVNSFSKVQGVTKTLKANKFSTSAANKFSFTGKRLTQLNVFASVSAKASATEDGNAYAICIMKNGSEQVLPNSTVTNLAKNQGFQINLQTQVEMIQGDYIELFMKSNNNTTPITVSDMQFKITE